MKQEDMKTKPNRFDYMLQKVIVFTCAICRHSIKGTIIDFMKHLDVDHYGKLPKEVENYTYKFDGLVRDAKGIDYFDIDGCLVQLNYTAESPKKEAKMEKKENSCPFCFHLLPKKSGLMNHIHMIHDKTCPKCPDFKIASSRAFEKHTKSKEHLSKTKFTCSSCRFSTYLKKSFWNHRLEKHSEHLDGVVVIKEEIIIQETRTCPFNCPFKCQRILDMKSHVHMEHDGFCSHCNFKSSHSRIVRQHLVTHLPSIREDPEAANICQNCRMVFCNLEQFWTHRFQCFSQGLRNIPDEEEEVEVEEEKAQKKNESLKDNHDITDEFVRPDNELEKCRFCNFKTDNILLMFTHRQKLHIIPANAMPLEPWGEQNPYNQIRDDIKTTENELDKCLFCNFKCDNILSLFHHRRKFHIAPSPKPDPEPPRIRIHVK